MISNTLANQSCTACTRDSKPVPVTEQSQLLQQLPGWRVTETEQVEQLTKTFIFPDFISAMTFANSIGEQAESANHHPAITIEWGRVTVTWWTHTIRGLHHNDFILAARTDSVYV